MSVEYRRFLTFLFRHKFKAIGVSVLAVIEASLNTLVFLLIPQILFLLNPDHKIEPLSLSVSYEPISNTINWIITSIDGQTYFDRVISISLIMVSIFIFKNLVSYLRRILTSWLNLSVVNDMRAEVFKQIQTLPLSEFKEKKSGHLLTLMTSDVNTVLKSIRQVFDQLLTEPLKVLTMLFSVFALSWKLSFALILIAPITTLVIAKIGKILKRKSQLAVEQRDVYMSTLTESFSGIKEIKAFNAEDYQFKRYMKEQTKLKILQFKQNLYKLLNMPLTEAMGSILIGLVVLIAGYLIDTDDSLDPAVFASILVGFIGIIEPMKKLGHIYSEFKVAMVSAKRLFDVIDNDTNELEIGTQAKDTFEEKITFHNVSFKYEEQSNFGLSNISFEIKKGEMVALVGSSGSGKSTLADLLARFYTITDGEILIDSVQLNDIQTTSLRKLITVVPQESFLFNDTIENNIRFNQNSDDDQIKNAAQIANAEEFVVGLDDGYQTYVGERGGNLSGGQRQRIAIARAVIKDAPIIILDEATSALDSESEKLVQSALDNLLKDHTSIVIAHRLSTIINADRIIVMNEGKIVESGTHHELLDKGGAYKNLYELQYGSESN